MRLAGVDAIIVTPMFDYESIEKELLKKVVNTKTISIEDIIYGL